MYVAGISRWTKAAILHLFYELLERGYEYPDSCMPECAREYTKHELIYLIEDAVPPTIFGHDDVEIEKEVSKLRWRVKTPTGVTLAFVSWHYVYDQSDFNKTGHSAHMYAALEACMVVDPLDEGDLDRLEEASPGLTRRRPHVVLDAESWQTEDLEEAIPEALDSRPASKPPKSRPLFPSRKIEL